MPSALIDSACQTRSRRFTQEEIAVMNLAKATYRKCITLILNRENALPSEDKIFLRKLADYMSIRFDITDSRYKGPSLFGNILYSLKLECSFNDYKQIKNRAEFIYGLLSCIESGDKSTEFNYLDQNKLRIQGFKGKCSKKLFNLLSERRDDIASYDRAFIAG